MNNPVFLCLIISVGIYVPSALAQSYRFSTIAGDVGYGTSDGTNTQARLNHSRGIVVGPGGELFFADTLNHTIRKLVLSGNDWVTTTIAGLPGSSGNVDGTNQVARFNQPSAISVDTAGNLYVADTFNHTVRMLTSYGTNWVVTTLAGLAGTSGTNNGSNTIARFNKPGGIAVDSAGLLYVADTANHTVRQITRSDGNWIVTTLAGLPGVSGNANGTNDTARFSSPG